MTLTRPLSLRRKRRLVAPQHPSPLTHSGRRSEPFYVTVFKVGTSLFALCSMAYCVFVAYFASTTLSTTMPYREKLVVKHTDDLHDKTKTEDFQVTTLPEFSLGNASAYDAYGIAEMLLSSAPNIDKASSEVKQFLKTAESKRLDFSAHYGGDVSARALLERSLKVLKKSNDKDDYSSAMARRIHAALESKTGLFSMAFGGTSAVAGCGNYFRQSFPFVLEEILAEPMELLGLNLTVRNGAMEDVSAFPYSWCQSNFLGNDLDIQMMDFGPLSALQLETVIRTMVVRSDQHRPILVFRDSFQSWDRLSLIQRYVDAGALIDPIIVDAQAGIAPFQNVRESHLPVGFQNWTEFGAPIGAPGKVRKNLTRKQHELLGWLIAMHILSAMELVVHDKLVNPNRSAGVQDIISKGLPPPVYQADSDETWVSLLYGNRSNSSKVEWTMSSTECLTTFDPIISGGLEDAILYGTAGEDVDLLHPKGAMFFTQGWVMDLEPAERRQKQLMKRWDLGFQAYRKALYGVAASGRLSLFLPLKSDTQRKAQDAFKHLVVCETNARGDGNGCNLENDVTFAVGGVEAASVQWIENDSVAYRGRRLCVLVDIPKEATLESKGEAKRRASKGAKTSKFPPSTENRRLVTNDSRIGLGLDIEVSNKLVTWHKGSCSISHIIWDTEW